MTTMTTTTTTTTHAKDDDASRPRRARVRSSGDGGRTFAESDPTRPLETFLAFPKASSNRSAGWGCGGGFGAGGRTGATVGRSLLPC
ncbi:hypothetical protein NL676_033473 [Syzygium grande]|nr:hypothetical protein NL676_033473 [Syzygium grande]